ncbi:MAG: hypothetical protein DRI57_29165, partial [Deltaproteobacteria bacterium]
HISSITSDSAELFAQGIRGHRHVENRLHCVKDVVMNEDGSGIRNVNAAADMSVFRNIVINIFRGNGFDSVRDASIFLPQTYENYTIYSDINSHGAERGDWPDAPHELPEGGTTTPVFKFVPPRLQSDWQVRRFGDRAGGG